jgi:hypothetical protein
MAVIEATDKELEQIISEHPRVLLKFIDRDCRICEALRPKIQELSEHPQYHSIVFLTIDAATNPIAASEVQFTKAPFFASYVRQRLMEVGVKTTEPEVKTLLDKMLACD